MTAEKEIHFKKNEQPEFNSMKLFGSACFGYKRWKIKFSGLVPSDEEASILTQIFNDHIQIPETSSIVKKLNKSVRKTNSGKIWSISFSGIAKNDEDAAVVSQIFTDYINGLTCVEIARKLNKSGKKTRKGKKWRGSNVGRILENPIYCGCVMLKGKYVRGKFEPIVSVKMFNACQIDENKKIHE